MPSFHQLKLFPLVAGGAWFITLFSLLIAWLAQGRPRYPLQSNPYVAFISDIGAFQLKPLFITGAILTAITFAGTIISAHFLRYSSRHGYLDTTHPDKRFRYMYLVLTGVAVIFACAASLSLVLLSFFDTYRHHERHGQLLLSCFLGLTMSAFCTSVVYFPYLRRRTKYGYLRHCCILNNLIVLIEIAFGVSMIAMSYTNHLRISGILEWCLSFVGAFYLWSFIGFFNTPMENDLNQASERTALLQA